MALLRAVVWWRAVAQASDGPGFKVKFAYNATRPKWVEPLSA